MSEMKPMGSYSTWIHSKQAIMQQIPQTLFSFSFCSKKWWLYYIETSTPEESFSPFYFSSRE